MDLCIRVSFRGLDWWIYILEQNIDGWDDGFIYNGSIWRIKVVDLYIRVRFKGLFGCIPKYFIMRHSVTYQLNLS